MQLIMKSQLFVTKITKLFSSQVNHFIIKIIEVESVIKDNMTSLTKNMVKFNVFPVQTSE